MDRDLVEYLQAMEQRMTDRINANTELLTSVSESLQREMHQGFSQLTARMDLMERRLDRHGSLLQTGARWTVRMATWSERVDKGDSERDKQIAKLENHILKIEE